MKWIEDRREHLMAIGHSREASCDVELAFSKDGVMLGMRGDLFINIGAYVRPNGMTPCATPRSSCRGRTACLRFIWKRTLASRTRRLPARIAVLDAMKAISSSSV